MAYKRVAHLAARKQVLLCECGDHAWAILTRGYVALVSPANMHLLTKNTWQAVARPKERTVYARRGDSLYLHQAILETDLYVDHKNRCGLDNRDDNLRSATRGQNAANVRAHRDGTSKFKGVCWASKKQRWRSDIYVDGRRYFLGWHDEEERAAYRYDEAAVKLFGEFARINFP
jgi:hypothetical protein